jgi:hypothetical protein
VDGGWITPNIFKEVAKPLLQLSEWFVGTTKKKKKKWDNLNHPHPPMDCFFGKLDN